MVQTTYTNFSQIIPATFNFIFDFYKFNQSIKTSRYRFCTMEHYKINNLNYRYFNI
jgi:hypothetical protein